MEKVINNDLLKYLEWLNMREIYCLSGIYVHISGSWKL